MTSRALRIKKQNKKETLKAIADPQLLKMFSGSFVLT